jgi:histidine ammonia-lyase
VEALEFVRERLEAEMNAATDNPLLFPETGEVLSGGNFHGEGLALACEVLGLALAELGAFAERRIAYILEHPEFPPFLIEGSGLRSGLMLAQYTAASLVSENKILAHPAVVDSIPTSGGKEDYNSLASLASWKTFQITQNVEYILAIELLTVGQALSFLDVQAMAPKTRSAYGRLRQDIPPLTEDRFLGQDIKTARRLLQSEELIRGI